jgi:hypothetical protein
MKFSRNINSNFKYHFENHHRRNQFVRVFMMFEGTDSSWERREIWFNLVYIFQKQCERPQPPRGSAVGWMYSDFSHGFSWRRAGCALREVREGERLRVDFRSRGLGGAASPRCAAFHPDTRPSSAFLSS